MKEKLRKIIFILAMLILTNENVYAVTNTYIYEMKDSNGEIIYRNFNGKQERQLSIEIGEHSSTTITGYCIDVGIELGDKKPISTLELNLTEYLNNVLNNKEKAENVSKKINEYMAFGYGYNGQNSDKYLIATQKLIWDELYKAGYRKEYYSNNVTFTSGNNTYDISTEENNIKNNINNYYKTPSICSSQNENDITFGETKTYVDTSNVISKYNVICDEGLECEIKENKLIVTATKSEKNKKIKFTKDGINGNNNIIYQRTGEQAVLTNAETIKGVSCEFEIDVNKENEQNITENVTENVETGESKNIIIIMIGIFSLYIAYLATKKI